MAQTAAVDLLIAHRYWLTQPAFTARSFTPSPPMTAASPAPGSTGRPPSPRWNAAAALLGLEASMLRVAASLGSDLPLSLRAVLGGLDAINIAAVTTAITAANGTRP